MKIIQLTQDQLIIKLQRSIIDTIATSIMFLIFGIPFFLLGFHGIDSINGGSTLICKRVGLSQKSCQLKEWNLLTGTKVQEINDLKGIEYIRKRIKRRRAYYEIMLITSNNKRITPNFAFSTQALAAIKLESDNFINNPKQGSFKLERSKHNLNWIYFIFVFPFHLFLFVFGTLISIYFPILNFYSKAMCTFDKTLGIVNLEMQGVITSWNIFKFSEVTTCKIDMISNIKIVYNSSNYGIDIVLLSGKSLYPFLSSIGTVNVKQLQVIVNSIHRFLNL